MELWTDGWSFLKTPLDTTFEEMKARKKEFEPVDLPHDWLIYNAKELYEDSFGWYKKSFDNDLAEGERLQIRFDGVYMDCTVYVNGKAVMDWKYGYTTFDADVTDFLKKGKNEIVVLVRHRSPNSRWYSGAGIYRNVWKKVCKKAWLPLDGTYVVIRPKGSQIQENHSFDMELSTELAGDLTGVNVQYELIREADQERSLGDVAKATAPFSWKGKINAKKDKATLKTVVEDPALWDVEMPNVYLLSVRLCQGKTVLDSQVYTVGFRSLGYTPEEGMFLNGRRVKVHGVCEHHDLGCLGAAFNEKALERQFKILKEMGVNGIRTSHNPPAPEFMELADRMGFLVDSECFDMWERPKTTYDYARFFIEWAGRDVRSWVRRDRNHPSVFLWSIGNEIYDTHADSHGQEITKRLADYVHENDPKENARATIGSNYMPWEGAQKCMDIVKMAGYNYGEKLYELHHKEHPDWIMYGSETASVVQSRGIYHFPLSQSILSDEDLQCSALGNSSTSWGAESTERVIIDDRDATFTFGMFIWTGFDYIGEPTPYHTKNSYFGQIDTAGFPKDPYYVFQAEWTDYREKPMVHVFPHWDFNPGQMVDVRACTNAPQVELFVNGRRQGRQIIDHEKGTSLLGNWRIPYEPGVITAVAYDENGKEIARDERRSFTDSRQISLLPDKFEMDADGRDLIFVTIETLDEKGHPVENAVDYVTVRIEGPARLLGMDNGDSTDEDDYKACTRKLFSGKLLAVIGATGESGPVKVIASGDGLLDGQVLLEAVPAKEMTKAYAQDCLTMKGRREPHLFVPTRKIEICADEDRKLSKRRKSMEFDAFVYPVTATPELLWRVVDPSGIELPTAKVEELPVAEDAAHGHHRVKVTALGDGEFVVRCMAKEPDGRITVISSLEFEAKGLGTAFLNPYGFIAGGLYKKSFGDVGNGNEKGVSTARNGESWVLYENVDFGEYGSDEITIPIFALNGDPYDIEVWEGIPEEEGSTLINTITYQKPSIWNEYQEETWKLSKRLKGVTSVGFLMRDQKIHIKGFSFKKLEKAYGLLYANEASRVYGDEFQIADHCVNNIGNNVTMEFENMDFGETGATGITICGWTPLEVNTIHLRFRPEDGSEVQARMVEFAGTGKNVYGEQSFTFQKISGKGRLDLVFLPGCQFNLESLRFQKDEE
ncbi:MAG: DUF4982 domain-containing protein [Lachnospiraceae bacterium]|nr:DUF4982 domain-containing protein [Lachnospiraceae bacterium]